MGTIRRRFSFIFVVYLFLVLVLTLFYCKNIFDLKEKVVLIERFDDLRDNLLELRRYEKNFFLANDSSSLDKINFYLSKTDATFSELKNQIKNIMGAKKYAVYEKAMIDYKSFLQENIDISSKGSGEYSDEKLRENGKILNDFTDDLISIKRKRIDRTLNHMLIVPIVFSLIFVIIFITIIQITQKDIFDPLALLQRATLDVANGVFKPVKYSIEKSDEVSQCLNAFNKMAHEIETHQMQLLQSRKMASIGTFTSGIAHELNNPINNISLIVDTLIEDNKEMSDEEIIKLYNDLMDQADRAADVVKSLLEFSRTDQEHLEKIPLEELVDKTVRLVKNEMQLQRIKYKKEIKDKLLPAWIDKSRLQQALLNLLINAIQAMPNGGILTITLGPGDHPDEIRLDVSDTGVGIPEKELESIFDPFFTTKKEGEGTGLGLSVTYGIIQKHGGRITVKSLPGVGTCFSIFLSARSSDESE